MQGEGIGTGIVVLVTKSFQGLFVVAVKENTFYRTEQTVTGCKYISHDVRLQANQFMHLNNMNSSVSVGACLYACSVKVIIKYIIPVLF